VRSSRVDTFTLVTLGRLTLLSPKGDESESLAKRRLKLAILAVLAAAKRPISRATLAEMFWGDEEECRARHSLSDALSHLRRELGRRAIMSEGGEVSLGPDAPLVVDATMFEDAVDARDIARASTLYSGPFLDGVDIEASQASTSGRREAPPPRDALPSLAASSASHTRAPGMGRVRLARSKVARRGPLSVDAALFRLNAVKAASTRSCSEALDEFEQLSTRLAREFDLPPEKPVVQLAQSLREVMHRLPPKQIVVAVPSSNPAPEPSPESAVVPNEPATPPSPRPRVTERLTRRSTLGRHLTRAATVGVGLVALVAALATRTRAADGSVSTRPRVAIAVDVKDADSATAWLADGLPQMMTSELSRSPEVEIVPPAQVRALLRRRGSGQSTPVGSDELRDLARRLGATVMVSGTIGRDDHEVVLDLAVRDVATGRLLRNDALSRRDVPALADEAAARVLATVNAQRPGFRSDVERRASRRSSTSSAPCRLPRARTARSPPRPPHFAPRPRLVRPREPVNMAPAPPRSSAGASMHSRFARHLPSVLRTTARASSSGVKPTRWTHSIEERRSAARRWRGNWCDVTRATRDPTVS
jgi:TolB-like protein